MARHRPRPRSRPPLHRRLPPLLLPLRDGARSAGAAPPAAPRAGVPAWAMDGARSDDAIGEALNAPYEEVREAVRAAGYEVAEVLV